jgi:2-acylglycerol O-acyltransferase 2
MYLVNNDTENIFLLKRKATIKAAIEEGAHIVPAFFFGNSSLFHVVGGGKDSILSKFSRKMRTSIVLFYGRFFLPVPLRRPLKMITGEIVKVKKNSNPSDEDIEEVLNRLVISINNLYENKRPLWETRPLVIE